MRNQSLKRVRRVAYDGLFAALAFGFTYVEFLLPIDIGVPGIKLGLANVVTLFVLYRIGLVDAVAVNLVRILLAGALFNASAVPYSICGAALSLLVMALLKKANIFSPTGVSVAGAVAHNLGQVLCSAILMRTTSIVWYFFVLVISGVIGGCIVGLLAAWIMKRFEKHVKL